MIVLCHLRSTYGDQAPFATTRGFAEQTMSAVFVHTFPEATQSVLGPSGTIAIRVAVKDVVDMVGTITTAGCQAVASTAVPASIDAVLLSEMRRLESLGKLRFVGKTNLHELAFGADGINPVYGTPTNPLDPGNVPGGSSSGSAVAVASGLADMALGSDTGGSIRIPAACCGIVGLKTTWGRIPTTGVWPLAPFLDTIGPMARTVAETAQGLAMLDPSYSVQHGNTLRVRTIGRVRLPDTPVDPTIDAAIDAALLATGVAILDITLPYWQEVHRAGITVILGEAWRGNRFLLDDPTLAALVHPMTRARLRLGEFISDHELAEAKLVRTQTSGELARLFERFDVLALPTITMLPPRLDDAQTAPLTALTRFANLTGLPALSLPVPLAANHAKPDKAPTSIQLIGPMHREDAVLAAGLLLERSVAQVAR
jgi:amidase